MIVIDVASQSTKVIRLNEEGMVTNFTISEKYAAGGGRFIEVIANVLRIDSSDFGPLASRSTTLSHLVRAALFSVNLKPSPE